MYNLKRYENISNALKDNLKYQGEKLIYKNKEINMIENKIPDFINLDDYNRYELEKSLTIGNDVAHFWKINN